MSAFALDWSELVTPALIDRLLTVADVAAGSEPPGVAPRLAEVFRAVGGLPIVESDLDEDARTALGRDLLAEACGHALADAGYGWEPVGFVRRSAGDLPVDAVASALTRVPVNTAPSDDLESLPVIGPKLAAAITEERIRGGPFRSMAELIERISGLGPQAAEALSFALRFDRPTAEVRYRRRDEGFDRAFRRVLDLLQRPDGTSRLEAALDLLATVCAGDPHPATRTARPRGVTDGPRPESFEADWVAVLAGSEYYAAIPGLIAQADHSLELAMFHIAFPSPGHPTRALLDAVVDADGRDVEVRVLLDRDRETDPYRSTVINTPARTYLESHGVPCRFDREDELLHSKYLILDEETVVIGSHNWSAGSFFHFDDLSLVIRSAEYASALRARFGALWEEGT